jgi:hypothetical protein
MIRTWINRIDIHAVLLEMTSIKSYCQHYCRKSSGAGGAAAE